MAAIVTAVFGVIAAMASQLAWHDNRLGMRPTYFGGAPQELMDSAEARRAEGVRERAKGRSEFWQTTATTSVTGAALVGLYAATQNCVTASVALIGLILGLALPAYRARRWWLEDRKIEAQAEYYALSVHAQFMKSNEIREALSKTRPDLVRWL